MFPYRNKQSNLTSDLFLFFITQSTVLVWRSLARGWVGTFRTRCFGFLKYLKFLWLPFSSASLGPSRVAVAATEGSDFVRFFLFFKKTVLCAGGVNVNHWVSSREPGCFFSVGVRPTQSNIRVKDAGNERMAELSGKQALFKTTPGVHTFSI